MRPSFVFLFVIIGLLTSCTQPQAGSQKENVSDPLLIEISKLEAQASMDTAVNRNTANQLIQAYQKYYNQNGTDSLSLHYLEKAARVADAIGKYDLAVDLMITCHDLSRDYEKKAESAFLVAFIYDDHLKNSEKAIEYYNKVIELYPKSQWAEQSKLALHLVDMNQDDLIRFLDEKNKKAS